MLTKTTVKRENAKGALKELMDTFKLDEVTISHWRDKYGMMSSIDDFELCNYTRDKQFENLIKLFITQYQYATSKEALDLIKKLEDKDNHYARFLGLREYEILKVQPQKSFIRYGVKIQFKDNGEERNFIETGLSYALKNKEELMRYIKEERTYFTAGGLQNKDVNFLFHGVGHSTKKDMYCFEPTEELNLQLR